MASEGVSTSDVKAKEMDRLKAKCALALLLHLSRGMDMTQRRSLPEGGRNEMGTLTTMLPQSRLPHATTMIEAARRRRRRRRRKRSVRVACLDSSADLRRTWQMLLASLQNRGTTTTMKIANTAEGSIGRNAVQLTAQTTTMHALPSRPAAVARREAAAPIEETANGGMFMTTRYIALIRDSDISCM
jgi:hypothetical protein